MALGEKVREAREKVGITQVELSKRLKASQRTITEIETGKREPSLRTIKKIASELGISVQELFSLEEKVA